MASMYCFLFIFLCGFASTVAFQCDVPVSSFGRIAYCFLTNPTKVLTNDPPQPVQLSNVIYFNNSGIIDIRKDAFSKLGKVVNLYLNENKLSRVAPEWFQNLQNLLLIDLSSNRIKEVSFNTFRNLSNIWFIYLAHNSIVQFRSNEDLSHATIDLSWNPLIDLQIGKVKSLHLNHTSLRDLHLQDDIHHLHAENSKIERFSMSSHAWKQISVLNLRGNNLTNIANLTIHGSFLTQLDLSKNPIGTVDAETFLNLPELLHLNLSETLMIRMYYGMFANQKYLKVLDVSNNFLSYLTINMLYPSRLLEELYVHNNSIYRIIGDLSILGGLRVLGIAGNSITCEQLLKLGWTGWNSKGITFFTPPNLINNREDNIEGMKCVSTEN